MEFTICFLSLVLPVRIKTAENSILVAEAHPFVTGETDRGRLFAYFLCGSIIKHERTISDVYSLAVLDE